MKIAVQMDHIASVHIKGDTTFALCLAAQQRGHQLFHYTPDRLSLCGDVVTAWVEEMRVKDIEGDHYQLAPAVKTDLRTMDVVLLRQDPPFDMNYISTTYLLERIQPQTLVINDPMWVRNSPEKIFVTEFADLMPQTLITRNLSDVLSFREQFTDIIIKPLYGNGGAGVFHLKQDDRNLTSLLEMFTKLYPEPFIVQRYLKDVREGDKRIILLDGEYVGAINRVPSEDDERSNMHVGGRACKTELTKREMEICQRIAGPLQARGLMFVGIDVIGGYLTEINVTSPTGIREIKRFGGLDIAQLFWQKIEGKLAERA